MMARRFTLEGPKGIGGGDMITPESEECLNRAEQALEQNKPASALRWAQEAVKHDANNLDAMMIIVRSIPTLTAAVKYLEAAEVTGRAFLVERYGDDIFHTPQRNFFWGVLKTRPYVRLVKMLLDLASENNQWDLVLRLSVQALRVSPQDAFGQHVPLSAYLFHLGRHLDALSFCQKWFDPQNPPELGGTAFDPPHRDIISSKEADRMFARRKQEDGVQGAVLHTAAVSAFTLWGDCPESRQYLELGAKINPLILFKILGRIAIPKRPSTKMRIRNEAEDAQSYLWRMQEHWMKPNVWEWADRNVNVKMSVRRICNGCETAESDVAAFKRCAGCHLVSYCDSHCQKADWPVHKELCRAHEKSKNEVRAFGAKFPKKKRATP
ncbi:hypothetical protein B0H11DRAFT_2112715 [Mycena galericulata]|nr:hypothetical protein B0H11DRAFT_2112715 [Mycena galericulata]